MATTSIKIDTDQISGVAESLAKYVRLDLIQNEERTNMLWFCGSLDFVKRLRKNAENEQETISIDIDNRLIEGLSAIIEKYIFKEIKELEVADDEWMEEMASLYMQLEAAKQMKNTHQNQRKEKKDGKNIDLY